VTGRRVSAQSGVEHLLRRSTDSRRTSHDRLPDARYYPRQP
jgi:hypothetical protein